MGNGRNRPGSGGMDSECLDGFAAKGRGTVYGQNNQRCS